jgi:hypothetical protein
MPSLVLLGLVLAGCASQHEASTPIDPELHQATVEVKGMV